MALKTWGGSITKFGPQLGKPGLKLCLCFALRIKMSANCCLSIGYTTLSQYLCVLFTLLPKTKRPP